MQKRAISFVALVLYAELRPVGVRGDGSVIMNFLPGEFSVSRKNTYWYKLGRRW